MREKEPSRQIDPELSERKSVRPSIPIPKIVKLGVAGVAVVAVAEGGFLYGRGAVSDSPAPSPIVRSVDYPSLGLSQEDRLTRQGPVVSGGRDLEKRLDEQFDQFKRGVKQELAGAKGEQVKLPNSPQEVADWFLGLDAKQQVSVVMYSVMTLYFARFLVRGGRAFIDPRGDIRLIKPTPKKKEPEEPDETMEEQEDNRPYGLDSLNEFLWHSRRARIKVRGVEIQQEIADITRQLASRISEGLSVSEAIDVLVGQQSNQTLTKALEEISVDIKRGLTLAQALGKHSKIFPRFYVNRVKSGEASGKLGQVLTQVADSLVNEGVRSQDRLDALKDSIVQDPQNLRSAMGVSGFLASSIIKFLDEGAIGNLDVNTNIMIVALFAALLPPFKAFDRFKEKLNLEYISKTAPAIAGAFVGINEAGLFYRSEDINFLQTYLIILTFGTLFKYASMGIGSREYVSNVFDLLSMPEDLRRFDALLKNRRIPADARTLVEALIDGKVQALKKKGGILDKTFAALDKSYREDNIDPDKIAITLPEWREVVESAVDEFIASVGKKQGAESENVVDAEAQRRGRAVATQRRHRRMTRIRRPLR